MSETIRTTRLQPFVALGRHSKTLASIWLLLILGGFCARGAVTWIGGNGNWNTPSDWSTGTLPGTNDDVFIPAGPAITVTHSSGAHVIHSLLSQQAFTLSGGSLTVATTVQVNNSFLLTSAGTLAGATVLQPTNGFSLVVEGTSGTLDGVTVNGTLDVGNTETATLNITNGLTLNGTALAGNPTNANWGEIKFSGTQRLAGSGLLRFGGSNRNQLYIATAGDGLTVGPDVSIAGSNGALTGAGRFWYLNEGTLSILTDATISVTGNWTNTGTIQVTNCAAANFGGTFSTAGLGKFNRSGGNVYLTNGVLDNANATLDLNALGGSWILAQQGVIQGGVVSATNGVSLIIGDSGSLANSPVLNGVTLQGNLDVGHAFGGAFLMVSNGLVLNGTALVGNPTNSVNGQIGFAGSSALGGDATIFLGQDPESAPYPNGLLLVQNNTTLTIGPNVRVEGYSGRIGAGATVFNGGYNVSNSVVVNLGTIEPTFGGGTMSLDGLALTNNGTISAGAGATVDCEGNLKLNGSAVMTSQPGGTLIMGGNLFGAITSPEQFTPLGTFSVPAGPHLLEAMSLDLGAVPAGLVDNFAYGTVALNSGAQLTLVNLSENSGSNDCVYVDSLSVPFGALLNLNGLKLYARLAAISGTVTNGIVLQLPGEPRRGFHWFDPGRWFPGSVDVFRPGRSIGQHRCGSGQRQHPIPPTRIRVGSSPGSNRVFANCRKQHLVWRGGETDQRAPALRWNLHRHCG